MVGNWAVVLPLLVALNNVTLQPITEEYDIRQVRQLNLGECCPCPENARGHGGLISGDEHTNSMTGPRSMDCPCQDRDGDSDASASMLTPVLRAIQPFMKQAEQKTDPKPLLQPEVGLASSVLETLREVTDEEYQDALARDAARSVVKIIESDLSPYGDPLTDTPKNVVRIFLNPKEGDTDDMEDNLPEPSHVQETRCIHSPLESIHNMEQLRKNRPTPLIEVFETPRRPIIHKNKPLIDVFDTPRRPLKQKQTNTQLFDVIETQRRPAKKINNKGLLHRNRNDMDSSVGASNVQERVLQPNTDILKDNSLKENLGLSDIFSVQKIKSNDDSQESNGLAPLPGKIDKKLKPKINLKLRDFFDNLRNTSNTEKLKMPIIDLKEYFASTTRLPPLKFKPVENPLFRKNRPQMKDLLKLKDVETFSQNDITKFTKTSEKPNTDRQNLKLQENNCKADIVNLPTSEHSHKEMTDASEALNTIISVTSLNPTYDQDNITLLDQKNDDKDSSEYTMSLPLDNEAATICETETDEISLERPTEIPQNNSPKSESVAECLAFDTENETPISHKINDDDYQIELVEDLNLPLEFDDSFFGTETESIDTANKKKSDENTAVLHDPIAETSNNDFQFIKQNNKENITPQLSSCENKDTDYDSQDVELARASSLEDKSAERFYKEVESEAVEDSPNGIDRDLEEENSLKLETIAKPEILHMNEKEHVNIEDELEPKESSDKSNININYNSNTFSDPKDNSRQVTYKDLQEMSNSILSLSECDSPEEEENIENNNVILESDSTKESGIVLEESNEIGNENGSRNLPISVSDGIETRKKYIEEPECTTINEMIAEASESDLNCVPSPESKTVNSDTLTEFRHKDVEHNSPKVIGEEATNINSILQVDKHATLFNNLKSKIGNLFSTTERPQQDGILRNSEDNVNESSNDNPVVALLNDPKSLNKFARKSSNLLRENLRSEIPTLTLKNFKNKLTIPKTLDKTINLDSALNSRIAQLSQPIARKDIVKQRQKEIKLEKPQSVISTIDNFRPRKILNNIESPFDLNRNFEDDIFGPGSSLNNLSDRLRSHTENTIQNIKDSLESRLKDSQINGLRITPNTINNEDILDTISTKRNELNEKLQAIHADINDRFSSFQQDILDQLNAPSVRNSEFDQESMNKILKPHFNPLQLPLQESLKFKSINNKENPESVSSNRFSFSEDNEKIDRFLKIPKKAEEKTRLQNLEIPNLKEVFNKQSRILLERNNHATTKETVPLKNLFEQKLSLYKPSINTSTQKIPRPKYFKTKIDIGPSPSTDPEIKATKNKPLLTKHSQNMNLPKEPENSPSSRVPASINPLNINGSSKEDNLEESSTDSPLEKLRKSLLRRNQELKSKNLHKTKDAISLPTARINNDEVFGVKEDNLNRFREGRTRLGSLTQRSDKVLSRNEDDKYPMSHSQLDTTHSATENVERVKLVEPLHENVPYKCKLICYKDV